MFVLDWGWPHRGPIVFDRPRGLAFDVDRAHLYIVDSNNHRVVVVSSHDGSVIRKFGEDGKTDGRFRYPYMAAVDHEHERVIVSDRSNQRLQVLSLQDYSHQRSIGRMGLDELEFQAPRALAIDRHTDRLYVVDTNNFRLQVLSLVDLSFVAFFSTHNKPPGSMTFSRISDVAVDSERARLIVSDTERNRIQVWSAVDGAFLFEFGVKGSAPGQLYKPQGLCVDNHGRILVADTFNRRLQAFTPEGNPLAVWQCNDRPWTVAFDERRGLIAYTVGHEVHVIAPNRWLLDTFHWTPDRHAGATRPIRRAVLTVTMIRSLVYDSIVSLLPNELLFQIFEIGRAHV